MTEAPRAHTPGTWIAVYDEQCEICQAGVSWIKVLDTRQQVDCRPIQAGPVTEIHPDLELQRCLEVLHVVAPTGAIHSGWDAVANLARLLPRAKPLAWLDATATTRRLAERTYNAIAASRHELSTCRGGACPSFDVGSVRARADGRAFWTCRTVGATAHAPLIASAVVRALRDQTADYLRTRARRIIVVSDELELWFLGGQATALVPLAFGERFCAIWYRGVLVDPGSTRMRQSLDRHLTESGREVKAVTATHAHEEHVGNLDWAARRTGAPLLVPEAVAAALRPAAPIPRRRAAIIGQPPDLSSAATIVHTHVSVDAGPELEVLPAAGHCPDHVVFWDAETGTLLAGDTFMGAYFSSPNADVDSRAWMDTLQRIRDLPITTLVEGHGHVHTLRRDIPDVPGVVVRHDPHEAIDEKLRFLAWLANRIEDARAEGRSVRATVASCFPWGRAWSWERWAADRLAQVATSGEFSRHEVVRSFARHDGEALPHVFQAQLSHDSVRSTSA